VALDRLDAEGQRVSKLLVGLAGRDQTQHLDLTRRETLGAGVRSMRGQERVDPGDVRAGAQARVGRPRRLELHPSPCSIAERTTGEAQHLAGAGRRMRDPERLPLLPGEPQLDQRLAWVSRSQLEGAPRLSGGRPQDVDVELRRDLSKLGAGGARTLVVAPGQQDLDLSR
jgi:hypothetical protein